MRLVLAAVLLFATVHGSGQRTARSFPELAISSDRSSHNELTNMWIENTR